jgi:hypothetical protein
VRFSRGLLLPARLERQTLTFKQIFVFFKFWASAEPISLLVNHRIFQLLRTKLEWISCLVKFFHIIWWRKVRFIVKEAEDLVFNDWGRDRRRGHWRRVVVTIYCGCSYISVHLLCSTALSGQQPLALLRQLLLFRYLLPLRCGRWGAFSEFWLKNVLLRCLTLLKASCFFNFAFVLVRRNLCLSEFCPSFRRNASLVGRALSHWALVLHWLGGTAALIAPKEVILQSWCALHRRCHWFIAFERNSLYLPFLTF